ncbi:class I SAM-dependent methyltransferase [Novosphingobium terrae]|uniref:class I SAM-dependent methyltransferase n=1 Tax=Novosphingobium terrae TaxID=2726189 RepID=UPI00197FB661|nr:class I SAM-dependent methyltransferase [Novosphingobium terrae]
MPHTTSLDILRHNQAAWDHQAASDCEWSRPVSSETIVAARAGRWSVQLTPGVLPADWLGDVRGQRILCLASAGGQQGPVLAAAGAQVTVFDASQGQLEQDRLVAQRDGLTLTTVQGDMRDLSTFDDGRFDIIFHPISNHYVPDVRPVWREAFRVLRPGGRLLASFYNPVIFVGDRDAALAQQGLIRPAYAMPYADMRDLPPEALEAKLSSGEALVFGHSLTDLIAGQIEAGFQIAGFQEDHAPTPRFLIDRYLPTFIATLARKP